SQPKSRSLHSLQHDRQAFTIHAFPNRFGNHAERCGNAVGLCEPLAVRIARLKIQKASAVPEADMSRILKGAGARGSRNGDFDAPLWLQHAPRLIHSVDAIRQMLDDVVSADELD